MRHAKHQRSPIDIVPVEVSHRQVEVPFISKNIELGFCRAEENGKRIRNCVWLRLVWHDRRNPLDGALLSLSDLGHAARTFPAQSHKGVSTEAPASSLARPTCISPGTERDRRGPHHSENKFDSRTSVPTLMVITNARRNSRPDRSPRPARQPYLICGQADNTFELPDKYIA